MIVSASRRTDIPAFYASWMINRLRAGYCTVPNPFNRQQVSRISLSRSDVDAIVFWTRNPRPLFRHLDEIDSLEIPYYFQFTVLGLPRELDRRTPSLDHSIATFQQLSQRLGWDRVIWRYDPIVFSRRTPAEYHTERFAQIASQLSGTTKRVVVSIMDTYRKIKRRMQALDSVGASVAPCSSSDFDRLMKGLADTAQACRMEILSCAEEVDLTLYGIRPGRCVDHELIRTAFGVEVSHRKDPSQRKACGCVVSRDIGMYESCPFGCQYCYATSSFERAEENYQRHDPQGPSLIS